jgi:hypothetical protein
MKEASSQVYGGDVAPVGLDNHIVRGPRLIARQLDGNDVATLTLEGEKVLCRGSNGLLGVGSVLRGDECRCRNRLTGKGVKRGKNDPGARFRRAIRQIVCLPNALAKLQRDHIRVCGPAENVNIVTGADTPPSAR